MFKSLFACVAAAALALPISANATISYGATGLSGTFTTENFDTNAGDGSAAASQFNGITFGSGNYVSNSYSGAYPNMTNSVIANFFPCCQDPTSFSFTATLSELAFAFVSNLQDTTFSAFLNGMLVDSATFSTDYSGRYVSFLGMSFDEIRITSTGNNDAYILDNMQYKVPEPEMIGLMSIALVGLGLSRRKAKA